MSGPITQWDMHAIEELGLVKYDFLGLNTLGVIDDCLRMLDGTLGVPQSFVPKLHKSQDSNTYRMLADGSSIGVFQLDGGGMQRLLRRIVPQSIHDIRSGARIITDQGRWELTLTGNSLIVKIIESEYSFPTKSLG